MRRTFVLSLVAFAIAAAAIASPALAADDMDPQRKMIRDEIEAYMKDQKSDFRVYWKEGLKLETRNRQFKLAIGGRVQADFTFFADNDDRDFVNEEYNAGFHSGFEFRRVRLEVEGELYKYTVFKVQFDFAEPDETVFKDVYVGLWNLKDCWGCWVPNITIGHFKEYFSLEELTSSKYDTFMEQGLPVEAFAPGRNIGVGLLHNFYGERLNFGIGWWANTDDPGDEVKYFKDEANHITGRITALPWAPCDCETRFWEVGASFSYQFDAPDGFRYRSRPENHLGGRVVDTHAIDADTAWLIGAETAFVFDRFKVQGEYIMASVDRDDGDDPTFWGYYAYVSYLLGGKGFAFKRVTSTFDKIKPCNNFDCTECGKWGAWEFAARYSYLDLDDAGVNGGTVSDITVGISWYLNPNAKLMFNYVHSEVEDFQGHEGVDGDGDIFAVRLQVFW